TDAIISTSPGGRIIFWNRKAEALFGYTELEVVGRSLDIIIPERYQEGHDSAIKRVRDKGILRLAGKTMETTGKHRDGHEIAIEISLSFWESNGEPYFTAIIRDITARKKGEEALSQAQILLEDQILERTTDLIRTNEKLKKEITTRIHMQNALEESERKFRVLFNQTFQVIGLLKPDGTVLEINQTALDYFRINYHDSVNRFLWDLRGDQASEANRAMFQEAVAQAAGGKLVRFEAQFRFDKETVRTLDFSIKPVSDPEGLVPLLIIEGRDITERKQNEEGLQESEHRLRLLSSQVLVAQEKERKRISQELHDGIGQYLSAIKYRVEHLILTQSEEKGPSGDKPTLEKVIPVIQGAIEEIRRICMALRPSTLDDLGILATISWFCREFQATYSGILIKQKIQVEEQEIPALLKTVIFRIVQEALNNIGKHSRAGQISLNLTRKGRHLNLDIRDNGGGFDLKKPYSSDNSTRGMGLAGMKERAELSGGALTIHSQPGKGTRIQAVWLLGE
ncbi:MAG: PAS domain S-box protein, partial [Desulfobacteraceae bacterium]